MHVIPHEQVHHHDMCHWPMSMDTHGPMDGMGMMGMMHIVQCNAGCMICIMDAMWMMGTIPIKGWNSPCTGWPVSPISDFTHASALVPSLEQAHYA